MSEEIKNSEELMSEVIALRKLQAELFLESRQIASPDIHIPVKRKYPSVYSLLCQKLNLRGDREYIYKALGRIIDEKVLQLRNTRPPKFNPFDNNEEEDKFHTEILEVKSND